MDRSGFEPEASPMPRERSTPELPALKGELHSAYLKIKVSINFSFGGSIFVSQR